jgi:hypothetical protein
MNLPSIKQKASFLRSEWRLKFEYQTERHKKLIELIKDRDPKLLHEVDFVAEEERYKRNESI